MKDRLLFALTCVLMATVALAGCGCSAVRYTGNVRIWPDGTVWSDQTFYRRSGMTDFKVRQVRLDMPYGVLERVWVDGVLVMESEGGEKAIKGLSEGIVKGMGVTVKP